MKSKKHPLDFIKPGFSFKKGGAVPCHECMQSRQYGGSNVITSPLGQWAYPGEITRIPSNQITMQGVNYPVLGVDNTGYRQMMMPGGEYTFPGTSVTEYPMMYGQVGMGMPPAGMFDRGVQQSDQTRVAPTMRLSPEQAKQRAAVEKQKQIAERQKEVSQGKGKESFFGMFDIPVNYSGIERENAPVVAQKKVASEQAQPAVYANLFETALMAANPAFNIYKSVGAPSRGISYLTGSPEVLTADELADERFMQGLMGDFGGENEFFKMYDRIMEQKEAEKAVLPLRGLAESGRFGPEVNAMTKGQLPVSKGLASDLIGNMRYPEALKYPGSEVREMMPVTGVDLWRQYYMPHRMGGSIKKSKKSKR